MRKYLLPVITLLLVSAFVLYKNIDSNKKSIIPTNQQTGYEAKINLVIDYGNKVINNYNLTIGTDDTAFSILKTTAQKENINLETVPYDFGVFVKKIGTFESTAKKSWIYYVNGNSGQIAADKNIVKDNDTVLWKYETPKY